MIELFLSVSVALAGPDRSSPPMVLPAAPLAHPEAQKIDVRPGLDVWFVHTPGARKLVLEARLRRGTLDIGGAAPSVAAEVAWNLQDVATAGFSPEAMAAFEGVHEVAVTSWSGQHWAAYQLEAPIDELDAGFQVLTEVLQSPQFPREELARYQRDQRLSYLRDAPADPAAVARSALQWAWYAEDHPYGRRPDLDALRRLRRASLEALLPELRRGRVQVVVAGDVAWDAIAPRVMAALDGYGTDTPISRELPVPTPKSRVVAVDMPGQEQVAVRLRLEAPSRSDADRVPFAAVSWALGGHFLSRLNANLREDKGYTYGSRAAHFAGEASGMLNVSVDVAAGNTAETVTEIRRELDRIAAEGCTAAEIDALHREQVGAWNDTFGTSWSAFGTYSSAVFGDESLTTRAARLRETAALQPSVTRDVAARWLRADRPAVWVLVGPRAVLDAELADLGWTAEWQTPDQAILGR